MTERLKFPITRRLMFSAAVVFNHLLSDMIADQVSAPPVMEDDYPMGCYL